MLFVAQLGFPSSDQEPDISVSISPKALTVKVLQNYTHPFPWGAQSLSNPPSPPLALLSDWEGDASRQATAKVCRYFLQERGEQWEGDADIERQPVHIDISGHFML